MGNAELGGNYARFFYVDQYPDLFLVRTFYLTVSNNNKLAPLH
jgi:hypothetical protein